MLDKVEEGGGVEGVDLMLDGLRNDLHQQLRRQNAQLTLDTFDHADDLAERKVHS